MADKKVTYINVPEAVGVFESFETLQQTIYDLMAAGFSRYDISLLGDEKEMEKKLGTSFWKSKDLEDDPEAPRASFVSEEAMGELEGAIAGGFFFFGSYIAMAAMLTPLSTLAGSIAAIAIGGGPAAVIGTLLARRVDRHHRDYYQHQIENGGILLWVRVANADKEKMAVKILEEHSGKDVHVHDWSE